MFRTNLPGADLAYAKSSITNLYYGSATSLLGASPYLKQKKKKTQKKNPPSVNAPFMHLDWEQNISMSIKTYQKSFRKKQSCIEGRISLGSGLISLG